MNIGRLVSDWQSEFLAHPLTAMGKYQADYILNAQCPLPNLLNIMRVNMDAEHFREWVRVERELPVSAAPRGICYPRSKFLHVAFTFNKQCDAHCPYCSQEYGRLHDPVLSNEELLLRLDRALLFFYNKFPCHEIQPAIVGGDISVFSKELVEGIKRRFRYNDNNEYLTHNEGFSMGGNWKASWHIINWKGRKGMTAPDWVISCNVVIQRGEVPAYRQFVKDNPDLPCLYAHPVFDNDYTLLGRESQAVCVDELDAFRETTDGTCQPSISVDLAIDNIIVYPCCYNPGRHVPLEDFEPVDERSCKYERCELHKVA